MQKRHVHDFSSRWKSERRFDIKVVTELLVDALITLSKTGGFPLPTPRATQA
jgi:hypothetical protein